MKHGGRNLGFMVKLGAGKKGGGTERERIDMY